MAQALVEYNYEAREPDELTIQKGDIIKDIVFNSKGWWEGTLAKEGKRGMFPDNFVKLISDPDGLASSRQSLPGRKCKVLFSYKPAIEDELELQVGDVIDIISEVEEGWWKGKLKDKIGVFPSNFVEEINRSETREASSRKLKTSPEEGSKPAVATQEQTSSNSHTVIATSVVGDLSPPADLPVLPPKPVKEMCKVVYNYEAANPDELTLHEGDIITLITKEGQDPGWWKGEHKGKIGLFPDNFVQIITAPEETSPISKPDRPSKALTSSKSKEPISKPMTTSSMTNIASISRKYSDNVRPVYNLKQGGSTSTTTIRSSSSNSENITVNSTSAVSVKRKTLEKQGDNISAVDGACWSKSGSYTVTTETSSHSSIVNNSSSTVIASTGSTDDDLDLVGRTAMLTHPTASRVKAPKRRPPSSIYSVESLDSDEASESPATTITTMLNGDADAHGDKPSSNSTNKVPWVEELKLNQAKKSMQAGNKTRVMIGGTETSSSTVQTVTSSVSSTSISTIGTTSPEASKAAVPNIAGVTLRSHQTNSTTTPTPRPQSMVSSLRSALTSPQSNDSTITVPTKQWNDLLEKVTRLEMQLESQVGSLLKTVKELNVKLDEEKQQRAVMRQEIEKLTDMVTQV